MSALEGEISRCTSDQLLGLKENINTLFSKCVQTLSHDHHIRVINALLVRVFDDDVIIVVSVGVTTTVITDYFYYYFSWYYYYDCMLCTVCLFKRIVIDNSTHSKCTTFIALEKHSISFPSTDLMQPGTWTLQKNAGRLWV